MTEQQMNEVFTITKDNMYDYDINSSLGWDDKEKMEEMRQKDGFYILFDEGFVCIRFERIGKGIMCYLWEIQIKKQFQHQGIGTEMIRVIDVICKQTRCSQLNLLCLFTNVNAKSFYDKLGFIQKEEYNSPDYDYWILTREYSY